MEQGITTRGGVEPGHVHWRWEESHIVPYEFDEKSISAKDKEIFRSGMDFVESFSCIKFEERNGQDEFLKIDRYTCPPDEGQGSYVTGLFGKQKELKLRTCVSPLTHSWYHRGHIAHELYHVLGIGHTHKRPDRDNYIKVLPLPPNVDPTQYSINYGYDNLTTPYNCMSIMHYHNAYMVAKDPQTCDLKSTNRLPTWSDLDLLRFHYNCPLEELPYFGSGQGILTSHKLFSKEDYSNNMREMQYLQVKEGNTITLSWEAFDVEVFENHCPGCDCDWVKVVDGDGTALMNKTCGTKLPDTITSKTNRLTVEFKTDEGDTKEGFKISWKENVKIDASKSGVVTSPNYPNKYDNNMLDETPVNVPEGKKVKIIFTDFDIEEHDKCEWDWVIIYEGNDKNKTLLPKSCGSAIPKPIKSQTNSVKIEFRSDRSVTKKGFRLTWTATE